MKGMCIVLEGAWEFQSKYKACVKSSEHRKASKVADIDISINSLGSSDEICIDHHSCEVDAGGAEDVDDGAASSSLSDVVEKALEASRRVAAGFPDSILADAWTISSAARDVMR